MKSMHKNILLLIFFINGLLVSAQNEIEVIKIEYTNSGTSNFSNSPYPIMDQIASANSNFSATLNYGHNINSDTWQTIYSLNYNYITQQLDLSKVSEETIFGNIPSNYYSFPNFSQISFSSGVIYNSKGKWSATLLGAINFTDDFSKTTLKPNFTWMGIAYLERKHSDYLSYGFGGFINQLENKLYFMPSASFKLQNAKRGIELLFPDKIRIWQKIKEKNYIEAAIKVQALSVEYPAENIVKGLDIYTIKAGVEYNLVWQEFVKLAIGVNFPIILNSINSATNNFDFLQQQSIGFSLSLSIVLPDE